MEVTNTSPSPASPTEGDDLCEADVTSVAMHSVTLLICICGLVGNGAVIGLLSLKSRNEDIFDLAVMDFLFLLFEVPSALLFLVENISCSPILPLLYMDFFFQLSLVSCSLVLFRLMPGGALQYMGMLCYICFRSDLPERLLLVLVTVHFWAFFTLFAFTPTVTFLCPSQDQEQCPAALISMYTLILLLLAAPAAIESTINFIKAKRGSQQQQPKRRNMVIFLIVLFTLLLILWNFLQQLGYLAVSSQVVFLLTCIHSSIKPFIYFLVGRCWRPCSVGSLQLSLQRVFHEEKEKTARSNDPAMDTGV